MEKTLSIITNFGCHYRCPYCIVKKNNIHVPPTTLEGLSNLKQTIAALDATIVSVSGGGDPLFESDKHADWWERLFAILEESCPRPALEVHTSYLPGTFEKRIAEKSMRMVYHVHHMDELKQIRRLSHEITRAVFVVQDWMTEQFLNEASDFVKHSTQIDEISFRQRVDASYNISHYLHDVLQLGHKRKWWYIQQCDYNVYYAENKIYSRYQDFQNLSL